MTRTAFICTVSQPADMFFNTVERFLLVCSKTIKTFHGHWSAQAWLLRQVVHSWLISETRALCRLRARIFCLCLSTRAINVTGFSSVHTFQVWMGSTLSMPKQLDPGTPQGSILSPLLFTIVINDLPGNITSSSALYADAFCFWESRSHIEHIFERCQDSSSKVEKWCTKWGFKLSVSKWQHFSLQKKETKLTFSIHPKHHSDS